MATSWTHQSLVIWGPDGINGVVGLAPGLTGVVKVVANSVAYTEGEAVRCSSPSEPHPRFDWTDAALKFRF